MSLLKIRLKDGTGHYNYLKKITKHHIYIHLKNNLKLKI